MEERGQVLLRYADAAGRERDDANPNGSTRAIAGVANERFNVFGLMPHPEHAVEPALGGDDGLKIFRSIIASVERTPPQPRPPLLPDDREGNYRDSGRAGGRAGGRPRAGPRARTHRRRVPRGRAMARAHADLHRAGRFLGDVVGALLVQILAAPSADDAEQGAARGRRSGRKRRRARRRRRMGRGVQNRKPQPSLVRRTLPGRRDWRRRNPARHLHDGRAAGRRAWIR